MNHQTEVVNGLNSVNLASRLATMLAICLADCRLNRKLETIDMLTLWAACEADGFTADTFATALDMLVEGSEVRFWFRSCSLWVPFGSPVYFEAMEIVIETQAFRHDSDSWESDDDNPMFTVPN